MTPAPGRMVRVVCAALLPLLVLAGPDAAAQDALKLVEDSLQRHALPESVYEDQTLILGNPLGHYTVRTLRYYARSDLRGSRRLAVIDTPEELRGMAVLVTRDAKGGARQGPDPASPLFGSNLTVADLEGEQTGDFFYELEESQDLDRIPHLVVKATPKDASTGRALGYASRRIYLRKDNLFMSRMDFLDRQGRLARRVTFRDPRPDESGAWRAGMVLAEDLREERRTLLKIERRVHSADYVPESVFGEKRGEIRKEMHSDLRPGRR